jgi:hypothetical protein
LSPPNDDGLLTFYIDAFSQLAIKGEKGEDVSRRVSILVENVRKHLDAWRVGRTTNYTSSLIFELRYRARHLSNLSPAQSDLLKDFATQLDKTRRQ